MIYLELRLVVLFWLVDNDQASPLPHSWVLASLDDCLR
jgi:hypothetical protein